MSDKRTYKLYEFALGGEPTSFLPARFLCVGQKDTGEDPPAAASVASCSGNAQIFSIQDSNDSYLIDSEDRADFIYNANYERVKMTITRSDVVVKQKYYSGDYEYVQTYKFENDIKTSYQTDICYIRTPEGLQAAYRREQPSGQVIIGDFTNSNVDGEMYYFGTDHAGSITSVISEAGEVLENYRYDAWGNRRFMDNVHASYAKYYPKLAPTPAEMRYLVLYEPLFDRGYIGEEHIDALGLINLNARLYDPVLGRFLSPDPYVQAPDNLQNFNRYAYGLNNPLMYIDSDGQKIKWWGWLLIGLGIDGLSGGALSTTLVTTGATLFPFTDVGYEFQKYISPVAIKFSFGFGTNQNHIGIDVSLGMIKNGESYRFHAGTSYYFDNYGGYNGWETRIGAEWQLLGVLHYSGTKFSAGQYSQTLNKITFGDAFVNIAYENDYMFDISMPGIPKADGGDRWRTAAVGINMYPLSVNLNMFTGDPDVNGVFGSRYNNFDKTAEGREYYDGNTALNPSMRAGVLSIGIGPFRFGMNSEAIRHRFQNKFAHDRLMKGESYWFLPLDIPPSWYFYFGTGSGNTLW